MRLVEFVHRETGCDFAEMTLLRHFNRIDRLLELGGSIEEFTSVQPTNTKWDFWQDGTPYISIVVVIVHDRVFGVFRVQGVEAEGTIKSLASAAHRRFDEEDDKRRKNLDRPGRRFELKRIPSVATGSTITGWEGKWINAIVRGTTELARQIEVNLDDASTRLAGEEAESDSAGGDPENTPQGSDRQQRVERQIRARRGQRQFRNALRKRYGDSCMATGCKAIHVLEAAHIATFPGEDDNDPKNGLLLRSDIHTLFDLDLLGIEPTNLKVELHPGIESEYRHLVAEKLNCAGKHRPSPEALSRRYELFKKRASKRG